MSDNRLHEGERFNYIETDRTGKITHRFHNISAVCPVGNDDFVDAYELEVSYNIVGYVAEVGTLSTWMDEHFRNEEMFHLDLVFEVGVGILRELPEIDQLEVTAETNQYRGVDNEVYVNQSDLEVIYMENGPEV